jgi:hypothetical protein
MNGHGTELEDKPLDELDDQADREELRGRYYGLMQELRVMLPGVQITVAFLLTAPFSSRFADLDDTGRLLWGIALATGALAIVTFLTPTALHRLGPRRSRRERLRWGIRMVRIGLIAMSVSLICALTAVFRFVFDDTTGTVIAAALIGVLVACWFGLPALIASTDDD